MNTDYGIRCCDWESGRLGNILIGSSKGNSHLFLAYQTMRWWQLPQGQLGLGGNYYAANNNHTNVANGFIKQAFVNFKHLG